MTETPEERRARKEAEKKANHERFAREVAELLQPLAPNLPLPQLQQEHGRLRGKIVEMQQLVITGRFDMKLAQDYERQIVAQIHKVEEAAHRAQTGGAGLPGEGDRRADRAVR